MRFVVDCMCGKLAKWLRILGFDVIYFRKVEDDRLISLAAREKRIILTRDTRLIEKARGMSTLFVESEEWKEQVKQVLEEFDLWKRVRPYSRCLDCNTELKNIPRQKARNLVSPFVYEKCQSFALCPNCGRVFWKGTHFRDMELKIGRFFKKEKKSLNGD
ncbi:MAG: Mut7-C RNAse domain-containing protein [Candidatus Aminicenantales bacterium]